MVDILTITMELGGRLLLTLLAIDILLLLILESRRHGYFKNGSYRSTLSGRYKSRTDTTPFGSEVLSGVEALAVNTKRVPTRSGLHRTRLISPEEDLFRTLEDGTRRADGITIDTLQRSEEPVRHDQDKLPQAAVSVKPLALAPGKE